MTDDAGFLPGVSLYLVFAAIGCALAVSGRQSAQSRRFQAGIFLLALSIRFAASVAIYQFGLVEILKDEDASGWVNGAVLYNIWEQQGLSFFELPYAMRHMWTGQQPGPSFLRYAHRGFYFTLGLLFYLTDSPVRLAAAALNCFFGALSVLFSYRIAAKLFSDWVARRAAWWMCLFPSLIIWSAMTIKEPVVDFLEILGLYGCLQLTDGRFKLKPVVICIVSAVVLMPFRFYACYIVGTTAALCLVIPRVLRMQHKFLRVLLTVYIGPILGIGVCLLMIARMEEHKFNIDRVSSFRKAVSQGGDGVGAGSGVVTDVDMRTPAGLVLGIAVGAAHLALAPFPWQLGGASARMALTLPELLFWWYLFFVAVVPGTISVLRHRLVDIWPIALFLCAFGLLYSAMFGNVGLVFRQRAQLLPFLLLFGAFGLEQRMLRRRARRNIGVPQPVVLSGDGAVLVRRPSR